MPNDEYYLSIKRGAEADLRKLPGVHGVALGAKFVKGVIRGDVAIQVFVFKKRPLEEIPEHDRIPAEIQGVPTDVIEASLPQRTAGDDKKYRPLQPGAMISVRRGKLNALGTLGCLAQRNKDDNVVALTNQHVVNPRDGDTVFQPMPNACTCCDQFCCEGNDIGKVDKEVFDEFVDGATIIVNVTWINTVIDIDKAITGTYDVTVDDAAQGYPG